MMDEAEKQHRRDVRIFNIRMTVELIMTSVNYYLAYHVECLQDTFTQKLFIAAMILWGFYMIVFEVGSALFVYFGTKYLNYLNNKHHDK